MSDGVIRLEASPMSGLVDDPLHVTVSGLTAWQSVTVAAVLREAGQVLLSYGHFVADDVGRLDLDRSASHGGSYRGVEPVGLLWSMAPPAPGQKPSFRLLKQDVENPLLVEISVVPGHRTVTCLPEMTSLIADEVAAVVVRRYFQSPDVLAFKVRVGDVRGIIFIPPGDGPFPGVIDLQPTVPGISPFRAALLASRGFVALTVAYFKYEDLPDKLVFNLEDFEEALNWLHAHPLVLKTGLGIVGHCKGAAIAMHAAEQSDKVKALVTVTPPCMQNTGTHYYHGVQQSVFNPPENLADTVEGKILGIPYAYRPCKDCDDALIPVERLRHIPLLLITGEDDHLLLPCHVSTIISRLERHRCSNYTLLSYPGTGHVINPPYIPHSRQINAPYFGAVLVQGGEQKAHAEAQEDSWRRIQVFLWKHLDPVHEPQHHWLQQQQQQPLQRARDYAQKSML